MQREGNNSLFVFIGKQVLGGSKSYSGGGGSNYPFRYIVQKGPDLKKDGPGCS